LYSHGSSPDRRDGTEAYAAGFDKNGLPLPPGRRVAILACMDTRLNPYGLLGLSEGDAQ
jgi:carbonic anhydrase